MADVKISALPLSGAVVPATDVLPLVNGGLTTKVTPASVVAAALTATPATVAQGGTGAATLTGYVKGTGTTAFTASTTIPSTDITGLGSMAVQNASTVAITGGSINNTTIGGTTRDSAAFTTELVGPAASANLTRFPSALAVVSNTASGIQKNETATNIGLIAEGVGVNAGNYGVGLYGAGYTAGNARGTGVTGEGHVSASGDTASAIGVRGYSNDTHSGGLNVGLFADASGSATGNYALYMNAGSIYSGAAQTWTLNGDLTIDGTTYTVTVPTLLSTNGIGYVTAAQGTVTQITDKTTAVTLNKLAGKITMAAGTINAGTYVTFTLNNTFIGPNDNMIVNIGSGATSGAYIAYVGSVGTNSAVIGVFNLSGDDLDEALVLNFTVFNNQ